MLAARSGSGAEPKRPVMSHHQRCASTVTQSRRRSRVRAGRCRAGGNALLLAFAVAALALPLAGSGPSSASARPSAPAPLPPPGTAAQVAKLVGAASKIEVLPNDLVPNLIEAGNDDVPTYFPETQSGCSGRSQCVFGDLHSTHTVALFGDSHALMWLTALVPIAVKDRFRLLLLWKPSCPAADVTVWDPVAQRVSTSCTHYRSTEFALIRKLAPSLVLLASRTTAVSGAGDKPISDAAWKVGLERTITSLRSRSTRVAVIGDVVAFNAILPDCLAANPQHIQLCSVTNPNPKVHEHNADEMAAAKAEHVPYVNPRPWLCTTICSPVIGNMVSYYNNEHVSATYASYLSGVWTMALRRMLPH